MCTFLCVYMFVCVCSERASVRACVRAFTCNSNYESNINKKNKKIKNLKKFNLSDIFL